MPHITDRERRVGLRLPIEVDGQDARGASFHDSARTVNISGGGLCFESARNLPIGARLALRIEVPAALQKHFGGKATYRAHAVVCRMERATDQAVARIGVRFLGEV
jgi:c-di-GMP-binding flagellar brake protein YcgR